MKQALSKNLAEQLGIDYTRAATAVVKAQLIAALVKAVEKKD